jgi:hypothetical protein
MGGGELYGGLVKMEWTGARQRPREGVRSQDRRYSPHFLMVGVGSLIAVPSMAR